MTLSYREVGSTRGALPSGYKHIDREAILSVDWQTAIREVMTWGVKVRAGFRVERERQGETTVGELVVLHAGPVSEPVEVVYLVTEPDRRGFAYGTMLGHPLRGEELFVVERRGAEVWLHIRSFSAVAGRWRAIAPVIRLAQRITHTRYLKALS